MSYFDDLTTVLRKRVDVVVSSFFCLPNHQLTRSWNFFADYEEITAVICAHNLLEILLRD
jgi:hypothetical protein